MKTQKQTNWTHKVAKSFLGTDGLWHRCRTAFTGSESDCIDYARSFAAEQREGGAVGTRVLVLTRGGENVLECRVNVWDGSSHQNTESDWR